MEDTYTRICIYSFNSWGFGDDKQDICRLLMLENENIVPILCNQENFSCSINGYRVKQALPGCLKKRRNGYYSRENMMFIAVPKKIKENVLKVSPHWRIQAVISSTSNSKVLIINTYFQQI